MPSIVSEASTKLGQGQVLPAAVQGPQSRPQLHTQGLGERLWEGIIPKAALLDPRRSTKEELGPGFPKAVRMLKALANCVGES